MLLVLYCLDLGLLDHRLAEFPVNVRCAGVISAVRRMFRSLCKCTHYQLHDVASLCNYHIIDDWEESLSRVLYPGDLAVVAHVANIYWECIREIRRFVFSPEYNEIPPEPPFRVINTTPFKSHFFLPISYAFFFFFFFFRAPTTNSERTSTLAWQLTPSCMCLTSRRGECGVDHAKSYLQTKDNISKAQF